MSGFRLNISHKTLLRKASRGEIEGHFERAPINTRSIKWLADSNYYRRLCTSHYDEDTAAAPPSVKNQHLIKYVGASAPTHVIDGWSFLGRAVDATLRGDAYSAVHFGYYAELRAAMSLLAAEGIGMFNQGHPVVDENGVSHRFPNSNVKKRAPTHSAIWPILKYWATLSRAEELLDNFVRPRSIRLAEWFTATSSTIPVRAVAQHWLTAWGLDLAAVNDDHDSRNLVSYRPSELRRPPRLDVNEITKFVEELWQLFEPSVGRRFPNLERFLLRRALRKGRQRAPTANDLGGLGLPAGEVLEWLTFIQQPDDPLPLRLAEQKFLVEESNCHLSVISRAALLLFLASEASRRLLSNATFSSTDLRFWWGREGEDRALWNIGAAPDNPQDLWADIEQAINDSSNWRTAHPANGSLREWRLNQAVGLADLSGFELVGIWALLP
jgi:hypothetical protein